MARPSHENLRTIRFAGEMLPNWAQLLDLASRLCPVSEETRHWFSTLTNSTGVDDSRTVLGHCERLRAELHKHRDEVIAGLRRLPEDGQVTQIYAAWVYALDTMIQQATSLPTCSWQVEGLEQADDDLDGGGEITLRRI